MRIDHAVRRRRPLSLTSLIDIIFLLLLFFMLSSTFTRFAEVEITGGRASAGAAGDRPDVIMRVDGGSWAVNGRSLPETEALAELTRLQEAGAKTAVIMVREETTSQMLVAAVEKIRRGTGLKLSVAR